MKVFIGGLLGKPMMQAFGQLGLTTFSNGVNCFAQILGAIARSVPGMYLHVLVTGVGERKRDGVETLLTGEAQLHGFGRGEIAAGMSNLRSISNIIAPLLFAGAYNWGARQPANLAKVLFLTRMVFGAIVPELTFRMIPLADRQRMATM